MDASAITTFLDQRSMYVLFFMSVTCVALLLTGLLRRYSFTCGLMDVPNERSSHSSPIPRGGGAAIVFAFLGSLPILSALAGIRLAPTEVVGLGVGGAWICLIGFLDDKNHIPAQWRFLAHILGAGWILTWQGGLPPLPVLSVRIDMGWFGWLLALFYLVWLLNLYNFMDGIDGIAGIEAITVCGCCGFLGWLAGPSDHTWILPILLAAAVTGFLFWNFPSAKIFMGDAGSGFLGLMLGAMSIRAAWSAPQLFWCWVILLGVFVVDATITLLRRIVRREKFYKPHRSHAYQYASRYFRSHKKVSIGVGAINVLWLLPVATLVAKGMLDGVVGVGLAYAPLVWLALRFHAGDPERQEV